MKHPAWVVNEARTCLHSHLALTRESEKLEPDYRCAASVPRSRDIEETHAQKPLPLCALLLCGTCGIREPFPESQDH